MSGFLKSLQLFIQTSILLFCWVECSSLVENSRTSTNIKIALKDWNNNTLKYDEKKFRLASLKARSVADLYINESNQSHLSKGMLVNRRLDGKFIDHCDSLLFSSLRFIALSKLSYAKEADLAWDHILKSNLDGQWVRHPLCHQDLTRDMILGLFIALSQSPISSDYLLVNLNKQIKSGKGYFDDGPIHRSFLSPGLGQSFRFMLLENNHSLEDMSDIVRFGFSTIEFDAYFVSPGYQAHLIALNIWLELEIRKRNTQKYRPVYRSLLELVSFPIKPFLKEELHKQRLLLISNKLVQIDERNMFFRYLYLRVAGLLNKKTRALMLDELLSLSQFPHKRLPMDCDKGADYLWQRDSIEYVGDLECAKVYSGVDFLWMLALLLEDDQQSHGEDFFHASLRE